MTKEEKKILYDMGAKKAIKKLEALPAEQMDYDLIGILARAYNNNDEEQKAKDLMLTVKAVGEKDGVWNYRMGHSCFYLAQYEEALGYLERAKELGCGEWADELLPQCKALINKPKLKPVNADRDMVSQLVEYLDCPCALFNPMQDDDPLMEAFENACKEGETEGFIPMLIAANDETLWECLLMNSNRDDEDTFNPEDVRNYRCGALTTPLQQGEMVLSTLINERKQEAEDDEFDWDEGILGKMKGGKVQKRFQAIWDYETEHTIPLLLAKIPVKNPWEVFAYLPFGNWNECPNTPQLMSATRHWYEKHDAIPAVITHDQLEFRLKKPVAKDCAMQLALEQYGFCPDVVDQGVPDGTVGMLASQLSKSTVWSFWWD